MPFQHVSESDMCENSFDVQMRRLPSPQTATLLRSTWIEVMFRRQLYLYSRR